MYDVYAHIPHIYIYIYTRSFFHYIYTYKIIYTLYNYIIYTIYIQHITAYLFLARVSTGSHQEKPKEVHPKAWSEAEVRRGKKPRGITVDYGNFTGFQWEKYLEVEML